jgi:hypothetical protein
MTIIPALNDPLSVLVTDDLSNVMAPDHDRADRRAACVGAIMCPRPCQVVLRTRIAADLLAHVPSTPRSRPPSQARVPVARVLVARLLIARISKPGVRKPVPIGLLPKVAMGVVPIMMMGIMSIVVMLRSRLRTRCECKKQCTRGNDSTHTVFLRAVEGKGSLCDQGPRDPEMVTSLRP